MTIKLDLVFATLQDIVKALDCKDVTSEDLVMEYLGEFADLLMP